jgi:ammonium transporter Rh
VHIFGAYFGLAVAKMLNLKGAESHKEGSIYHSDFFAMIGTIFLWLYWPSFNSATAAEEGQIRAIVNTYLSITASCITAFIISTYVGKGKLNMVNLRKYFSLKI